MPELLALAATVFLFDESFSIYGGNVKSTMAGEFSFSIALSFAMLGLGVFARGLETGKYRSWAAILLALAMLCHGIVLIFVVLGAVLLWAVWMDRTRFIYGFTVLAGAVLLTRVLGRAVPRQPRVHDRHEVPRPARRRRPTRSGTCSSRGRRSSTSSSPASPSSASSRRVVRRHLAGAWLGICCLALTAFVFLAKNSLPVIGLLWNPRLLPFLYLLRLMLMMVGIVELVEVIVRGTSGVDEPRGSMWKVGAGDGRRRQRRRA